MRAVKPWQPLPKPCRPEKEGHRFNVALDPGKKVWDQYGTAYIPKNYLIDQEGVIRYVSTGYGEEKINQLAEEFRKLLKK